MYRGTSDNLLVSTHIITTPVCWCLQGGLHNFCPLLFSFASVFATHIYCSAHDTTVFHLGITICNLTLDPSNRELIRTLNP